MKFKKLTLAAAISIGLASVATGAFADCGCAVKAPCDSCCPAPVCAPACAPQPACPLEAPCACQPACPCEPACDSCCEPQPACPCEPTCCDKPACGLAPNVCDKAAKEGTMHYAYPENVFSGKNVIHADPFNISFGDNNGVMVSKGSCGCCNLPATASSCGCNDCGCDVTTGAAAAMPCLNDCGCAAPFDGAIVNRDCCKMEGAACPIEIKTQSSMQANKKTMMPIQVPSIAGAASSIGAPSAFCDVPDTFWANCDINKLVAANVIAGYPDRTFKPTLPVSRAEFASLIANGLEIARCAESCNASFGDVPSLHWANNSVQRSVGAGYMAGYPDNTFKPGIPISRAEAITTIAKAFKCELTDCEADKILSEYQDGCKVPSWAKMSVAKALKQGLLKDTPCPNAIKPCEDASRADVASMLSQARIALCIDKPATTGCACENKTAYVENCEVVDIPTLKVKMQDRLTASASDVGDHFAAETLDPVTINGVCYPACSRVNGIVVDVERPNSKCDGGLKIALTEIENGECTAKLPRQILNAQVEKEKNPNWFIRTVQAPFTLVGKTLGTAGRTVGGIVVNVGNAAEAVTNGVGIGTGEVFQGKFRAAGRSYQDSLAALATAPVDVARTSLSGAAGVLQLANDEIGYLVNPDGKNISAINPNEKVTFAFGVCK